MITQAYKVNEQGGLEQNLFPIQLEETLELRDESNKRQYVISQIWNVFDLYRIVVIDASMKIMMEKKCEATELMLRRGLLYIVDKQFRFRETEDERVYSHVIKPKETGENREEKIDEKENITMKLIAGGNVNDI